MSLKIKENIIRKLDEVKREAEVSRLKIQHLSEQNSWIDWISKYQDKILDWNKFSKEELMESINHFVEKVYVKFDSEKKEHIITIRFKLPLVNDRIDYKDPDNKSRGYKVREGKTDLNGTIPIQLGGRPSKINAYPPPYSTVTDFAKLRG